MCSTGESAMSEDAFPPSGKGGNSFEGGIRAWPRRRRIYGGGSGDAAVEFLDVREAALVSVAEALARRALPWQAQLCPRALQDLEIARTKVSVPLCGFAPGDVPQYSETALCG